MVILLEMMNTPDNSPRQRGKGKTDSKPTRIGSSSDVNSESGSSSTCPSPCKDKSALINTKSGSGGGGFMTLGHKTKLKQILGKFNQMTRGKPGLVIAIITFNQMFKLIHFLLLLFFFFFFFASGNRLEMKVSTVLPLVQPVPTRRELARWLINFT